MPLNPVEVLLFYPGLALLSLCFFEPEPLEPSDFNKLVPGEEGLFPAVPGLYPTPAIAFCSGPPTTSWSIFV